jgi:hypothetical protein
MCERPVSLTPHAWSDFQASSLADPRYRFAWRKRKSGARRAARLEIVPSGRKSDVVPGSRFDEIEAVRRAAELSGRLPMDAG